MCYGVDQPLEPGIIRVLRDGDKLHLARNLELVVSQLRGYELAGLERVLRGVYRMGGAPSIREEDVYAAWLSLIPDREPGVPDAIGSTPIAMGVTAAWLQGLGEIGPAPLEFCCEARKQTQRSSLTIRKRKLANDDIVRIGGLLATSPSRTILDLIDGGEDLSLVSNVLEDALDRGLISGERELAREIDMRSAKAGLPRGASLYEFLAKGR